MSAPKGYTTVLRKSERWLKGERPVAEVTQGGTGFARSRKGGALRKH